MIAVDMILVLFLVTFALVSIWMYQSKLEAEEGLVREPKEKSDNTGARPSEQGVAEPDCDK